MAAVSQGHMSQSQSLTGSGGVKIYVAQTENRYRRHAEILVNSLPENGRERK